MTSKYNTADLTELNKLEQYLKSKGIPYERIDRNTLLDQYGRMRQLERHQICVPVIDDELKDWDVICNWGSYGYEEGLLELYGNLCGGDVIGYLTADDVIRRIESYVEQTKKEIPQTL